MLDDQVEVSISAASDTALSNPQNNQTLTYNSGTAKWVNATPAASAVTSVAGKTGTVTLAKADVGLGNVDNTSDANKPISAAVQTALETKPNETLTVTGTNSITGGGDLTANRTFSLVNDSSAPGNSYYYGTNSTGTKGYFTLPSGGGSSVATSVLQISDFAGATDDDKHVAAWTAARNATRKPILQYPTGTFGPLTTPIACFSGMRAIGPDGTGSDSPKNQEINIGGQGNAVPHRVQVNCGTGTSALFVQSSTLQEVSFANISYAGSAASQWWHNTNGSSFSIYPGQFHSLSFDGFNSVLGNAAQKFTITQVVFSGHWTVLNFQNTPMHIGGSDNQLWMGGYVNCQGPGSVAGAGKPLVHFDYLEKSTVGYMYLTNDNGWSGLRVEGPAIRGIRIFGGVYEGVNAGSPATAANIDIRGGHVMMFGPDVGQTTTASGAIIQSGGTLELYSPHYRKATAAAATYPMFYQTAGSASITRPYSGDGNAVRIHWKDAALGAQDQDIPFPTGNSLVSW